MATTQQNRVISVSDDEWRWLKFYQATVDQLGRKVFVVNDLEVRSDKIRGRVYAYIETMDDSKT